MLDCTENAQLQHQSCWDLGVEGESGTSGSCPGDIGGFWQPRKCRQKSEVAE